MRSTDPNTGVFATPRVSVVMANWEAGDKLEQAIGSVLGQSMADLELIICDDASKDDSLLIAQTAMRNDPRIRLIRAPSNGGPARSRNRGLEAARGEWIAIIDSDDLVHPERLERLLAVARHSQADIVADDLLQFFEDGSPSRLFLHADDNTLFAVTAEQWIAAGVDGSKPLGYLKPMLRRSVMGDLRYDEQLRIGEDYDLVLRLLLRGATMMVYPEPFYLYRRHSGSISHRLSTANLAAMLDSQDAMVGTLDAVSRPVATAFAARRAQLEAGLRFGQLVDAIKARRLPEAMSLLARYPTLAPRLWHSFVEGRRRRIEPLRAPIAPSRMQLGIGGRPVPAYVPVREMDWTKPTHRQVWLGLSQLGSGKPIDIICPDQSSRYAAGFIPMARVHSAPAPAQSMAAVAR
jgi:succinoglycan biosynthesis protein ExoO